MGKVIVAIASILLVVFVIMKWGGLILGTLGTVAAIFIALFFVTGGDS